MKISMLVVKDKQIIGVYDNLFSVIVPQEPETLKEVKRLIGDTRLYLKYKPEYIHKCEQKYWDIDHALEHINKLETNDLVIMPIKTLEFIVSSLNNWMDGPCAKYFLSEFECELEDLVSDNGFGYSENDEFISRTEYGTEIVTIKEYVIEILLRICQCKTLKDKIQTIKYYLMQDYD